MGEELAANTLLPTVATFGLELPRHDPGDAWWVPQGIATRFLLSGLELALQAPGPNWLSSLPRRYARREVRTLSAAQVLDLSPARVAFFKFAEAKSDQFQAGVQQAGEVQAFIGRAQVPPAALFQRAEPVGFGTEYRFFVRDRQVLTGSVYLTRKTGAELTYYDWPSEEPSERAAALALASEVAAQVPAPAAYVLDVGLVGGEPAVVEANPAWCAAWYGSNINSVVQALQAATTPSSAWQWRPDASMLARYAKQRPLPQG